MFLKYSIKRKSRYIIKNIESESFGIDIGDGSGQYAEYINEIGYDLTGPWDMATYIALIGTV